MDTLVQRHLLILRDNSESITETDTLANEITEEGRCNRDIKQQRHWDADFAVPMTSPFLSRLGRTWKVGSVTVCGVILRRSAGADLGRGLFTSGSSPLVRPMSSSQDFREVSTLPSRK